MITQRHIEQAQRYTEEISPLWFSVYTPCSPCNPLETLTAVKRVNQAVTKEGRWFFLKPRFSTPALQSGFPASAKNFYTFVKEWNAPIYSRRSARRFFHVEICSRQPAARFLHVEICPRQPAAKFLHVEICPRQPARRFLHVEIYSRQPARRFLHVEICPRQPARKFLHMEIWRLAFKKSWKIVPIRRRRSAKDN